jgi:hypothetical protein
VAEVEGAVVTATDVALARALGLFELSPTAGGIRASDLERYVDARLLVREARRLGVEISAAERAEAWASVLARAGGEATLDAWLRAVGVDSSWAREIVDDDLRRRRFVDLRFRALAFVFETDVDAALGPGTHSAAARETARARLESEAASRGLAAWLAEARGKGAIRLLLSNEVPDPLQRPGARP